MSDHDTYINEILDAATPLTLEQRTRLAELLAPVRRRPLPSDSTRRSRLRRAA
jgi:hypothetical protein